MLDNTDLQTIPGIGPKLAAMLMELGYRQPEDLRSADPERMYHDLIRLHGTPVDRCVLYVFRCAVYYASNGVHEPEKLKWWNWKDDRFGEER